MASEPVDPRLVAVVKQAINEPIEGYNGDVGTISVVAQCRAEHVARAVWDWLAEGDPIGGSDG